MTRLVRLGAASVTALLLLLGPTACGGDDDASDESSESGSGSGSGSEEEEAGGEEGEEEPAAGPAGGVVFTDVIDDPAATMTITAAGFEPGDLTVAVGDVVEVSTTDDGVYGVLVGDLDGYTVTGGLAEFFRFEQPGEYPVYEELTEATATITVE